MVKVDFDKVEDVFGELQEPLLSLNLTGNPINELLEVIKTHLKSRGLLEEEVED